MDSQASLSLRQISTPERWVWTLLFIVTLTGYVVALGVSMNNPELVAPVLLPAMLLALLALEIGRFRLTGHQRVSPETAALIRAGKVWHASNQGAEAGAVVTLDPAKCRFRAQTPAASPIRLFKKASYVFAQYPDWAMRRENTQTRSQFLRELEGSALPSELYGRGPASVAFLEPATFRILSVTELHTRRDRKSK
jgi:hypothetical protein